VTDSEALQEAKRLAAQYTFRVTKHGRGRQGVRTAQVHDIRAAVMSAKTAQYQANEDTWKLRGGRDLDGDDLDVVVAFEDGEMRVVTLF
jgi:hypothetical protein